MLKVTEEPIFGEGMEMQMQTCGHEHIFYTNMLSSYIHIIR